ncbi:MAG: N-6 DNA methylase [Bacteroidales bacterium]|nr:N-6 DNA methylase [Bacteroidales bacterium]
MEYNITKWGLSQGIDVFSLVTEEDVKIKLVIPFLNALGYPSSEMRFEHTLDVQVGTKKTSVRSDIEILVNNRVEMIIDIKNPKIPLTDKDMLQCISYAKLISTPSAIFAVVTNGKETFVTDIYSGKKTDEIPQKSSIQSHITRTRRTNLSKIEIREAKSLLLTLTDPEELYRIIKKCKDIIEKKGLIRSDQSFKEMTKILLVKMNEEKRAKNKQTNRFQLNVLETLSNAHKISVFEEFRLLFDEATTAYPIYPSGTQIAIKDSDCITQVIQELEPWSFLGTGDDIKGAVYEIFLKSTLRGDFDQYFTPREIVDFIVKFADPKIGDKILDPACGSGGFLIQSFLSVNNKILNSDLSDVASKQKFNELIDKCLWGGEADEDLHVLAKINLIMHGDGYNNIYQGDSLTNTNLPNNFFDLVLTNPPFTIPYTFENVLNEYELGQGRDSQELDILFTEKCVKALNEATGGELYIVLPEGLLNLQGYRFFREWVLNNCYLTLSVSLPEGAFIPFGKSVSKTCILGLRKKSDSETNKPEKVFLCTAKELGYEVGKSTYKLKDPNDLLVFLDKKNEVFEGIFKTPFGGECGWINQNEITDYRFDASYLLNQIGLKLLQKKFPKLVRMDKVCKIENQSKRPQKDHIYNYLEIPDISPMTGAVSNIRKFKGEELGDSFNVGKKGDLAYSRINPRKSRVFIIPDDIDEVLLSKEVYVIKMLEKSPIISKYVMAAILQSDPVREQLVRIATGSSSSRARVQEDDFLKSVFIPIPLKKTQKKIDQKMKSFLSGYWKTSQEYLNNFVECQNDLLTIIDKDKMPSI